jgi:hypothetical protein
MGRMQSTDPGPDDLRHSEGFLHSLMSRQLRLSITCAVTFLAALVGLPLANYLAPDLMARSALEQAEVREVEASRDERHS